MSLVRPLAAGDYYAFVTRDDRRPYVGVYAWSVRDALPAIPVPLKAPDPDVALHLAEVFAEAYRRGRYARSLRYDQPPPAPLTPQNRTWATGIAARARPC